MRDKNQTPQNNGFYWFFAVVEDTNDPEKLGRIKVRVIGDHTQDLEKIPTDDLPWAMPLMPIDSASISGIGSSPVGLVKGSHVFGFFRDNAHKQQPMILASMGGIPLDPPDPTIGFNDPQECFPDITKLEEPDTNRMARGVAGKHVKEHIAVTTRRETVQKGIFSASSSWDEPETPYESIYPYNKVWEGPFNPECDECEWGHIEEWDSTPGAERYFRQHKTSQNFLEIHPDGKEVRKIYGPSFEIDLASKHILIDGDYMVTVHGNKEERIKGNYEQVIDGNYSQVISGDSIKHVIGNDSEVVQKNKHIVAGENISNVSGAGIKSFASDNIELSSSSKFVAISADESSISVGSVSVPAIPAAPDSTTTSPSWKDIVLSCKEPNTAESTETGLFVPEIPSTSLSGDGSGTIFMKVTSADKAYIKASETHNSGHLFIPEIDAELATVSIIDGESLTYTDIKSTDIESSLLKSTSINAGSLTTPLLTATAIYGIIVSTGIGVSGGAASEGEPAIEFIPSGEPASSISETIPGFAISSEVELATPFVPGDVHL